MYAGNRDDFSLKFLSALENFISNDIEDSDNTRNFEDIFYCTELEFLAEDRDSAVLTIDGVDMSVDLVEPSDGEGGGSEQSIVLSLTPVGADDDAKRFIKCSFYYSSWGETATIGDADFYEVKPTIVQRTEYLQVKEN